MSVPLLATWPAMGERERETLMRELVEVCGEEKVGILEKIGILENWKSLWLVEEGREIRKKEKGKEIDKEKIFSLT